MIRSMYISTDGKIQENLEISKFPALIQDADSVLWVDFENTPPEKDEPILRESFDFHPLAIDDALQETHVPKIDDWDTYLYIVLHSISVDMERDDPIQTHELDVFLGRNFLVTHHDDSISAIDKVWNSTLLKNNRAKNEADRLLYRITDEIVTSYMPVIEAMDDAIDRAEDVLFGNPGPETLENIFRMKRAVLHVRRIIGPQREVMNKLARDDYSVIDNRERIYFRDVYDHLVRMQDITESIRDLVGGTLDTYLSVINNRMNEIMKTLTVITTMFMPISFIASFFGMNFFQPVTNLSVWTSRVAFMVMLAFTILTPVAMFSWMHRRGWM